MTHRLCVLMLVAAFPAIATAQALETETARPPGNGVVVGGVGVEVQASSEGTEAAIPTFVEGGLGDRVELVIEQVALAAVRPTMGTRASGLGDLEATLLVLAVHERARLPAVAVAAEVKIPTARNALLGTREADYTGYLVLSKRIGPVDLHLNASYAVLGDPPAVNADNVFGGALAAKYRRGKLDLFGELLFATAAVPEGMGEQEQGGELVGGETVGTLGGGYHVSRAALITLGLSIDNNAAVTIHPGLTWRGQLF